MIRVTLRLRVREGLEHEFESAWQRVAASVGGSPGMLRQSLARDRAQPRDYTITSDWESEALFHAFERSPGQDEATAPLRRLREHSDMAVQDLVVHLEEPG